MKEETIANRVGNVTSSEICAIIPYGKRDMTEEELAARPTGPRGGLLDKRTTVEDKKMFSTAGNTYIQQCNWERRSGIPLDKDESAKPLTWGRLMEAFLNELLDTEYHICGDESKTHPKFDYWTGSKDGMRKKVGLEDAVIEVKSPYSRQSFFKLADCVLEYEDVNGIWYAKDGLAVMSRIRDNHPDGEKWYWQIISNAAINNVLHGELVFFMPFSDQIDSIKEFAANDSTIDQTHLFWVDRALPSEIPHIKRGYFYNNIYVVRFALPQEDIELLTSRVELAGTKLEKRVEPTILTN